MAKGWLDNFGKEDNYNDSKTSAPEGFQGDGYTNIGRNYSPAWGGQFQMGGNVYPVNYVPQAQMGASIPGAVGFSYARTQSPARSNGKYAKKTMASAQGGMDFTQFGDTNSPKSKMQKAVAKEAASENWRRFVNSKEYKDQVKAREKAIVQDRKDRINKSIAAQKKSYTKDNWRQQLADETQAIGDKFRIFPEDPNSIIDAFNPGVILGDMASSLGQAPLRAQQSDSYMPYVTSVGAPLALGAIGGIGVKSTGQFINNIANPLAGTKDVFKGILPPKNILVDEEYFGNGLINVIDNAKATDLPSLQKLKNIESDIEHGEMWKYSGDDHLADMEKLKESAKLEQEVAYINSLENYYDKYIGNNWTDISRRGNNPVFLTGKKIEDLEKQIKSMPEGQQWSTMTEYKTAPDKGSHLGYIGDEADYIHDVKYRLPGNRFDREGMMKDFQTDAGNSFKQQFSNHNWKPNIKDIPMNKDGGVIKDDMGYWNPDNWNGPVEIGSNEITMRDVPFDVLGISDEGDVQYMKSDNPKNYKFKGKKVTEFRMAKNGLRQEQKGLQNLDQLTNFTNYNTKQPGGWLDNL